jgi:hypothetical protein
MEIVAGESPVEGRSRPLAMGLKGKQALFEFLQRWEVVGHEDLSLNDREILGIRDTIPLMQAYQITSPIRL